MVVDLWGGFANEERNRPWNEDTLCVLFSATKGIVATAAHMLVERGQIDLDLPIANYWPEYAQNGKERITLRQVMSHTAGVPFIDAEQYVGAPYDWESMVEACAAQKPEWEPGSTVAYHVVSFGWIVGEVIRRVSGQMPGKFKASEIAEPLGAEFFLGLPESQDPKVADWIWAAGAPSTEPESDPPSYADRGFAMFWAKLGTDWVNARDWRAAEIPAGNGYSNACGLAAIHRPLALGGEHLGVRIMDDSTIETAIVQQATVYDPVLDIDNARRAIGYKLLGPELGEAYGDRAFGHAEYGGSIGCADPGKRMSFGYVMNQEWDGPRGSDPRAESLATAIYNSIG
jgi:CubicO group peptidase (beta-lactamase class C family)